MYYDINSPPTQHTSIYIIILLYILYYYNIIPCTKRQKVDAQILFLYLKILVPKFRKRVSYNYNPTPPYYALCRTV